MCFCSVGNALSGGAQVRKVCFLLEGAVSDVLSAAHRNGRTQDPGAAEWGPKMKDQ